MNIFEAVKQSVTTRQAAQAYGVKVNRNGMAVCPFHNDKNPSMKVDRRYHCFGCGADGDVIDFTARLFGVGLREAAMKLAADFSVTYDSRGRASPKESVRAKIRQVKASRQEERECYLVLCDYLHALNGWKETHAPEPEDPQWHPCSWRHCRKPPMWNICWMCFYSGRQGKRKNSSGSMERR